MVDVLRIKRRLAGGAAGAPTSLANAEMAFNEQDQTLYYGAGNNLGLATSIFPIAGPGMGSNTSPVMDGVATPGTLAVWSRADHTHPSDASRFAVAGGTITGAVTVNGALTAASGIVVSTSGLTVSAGSISVPAGNLSLGAAVAASPIDLSKHIALYSTAYGLSITGGRLNYVVPAAALHVFVSNGVDVVTITPGGMTVPGSLTVAGGGTITGATLAGTVTLTGTISGGTLAGPALTGVPTAPTAAPGTSTTQIATTAFAAAAAAASGVQSFNTRTGAVTLALADVTGAGGAPLASPTFTGTVTVPLLSGVINLNGGLPANNPSGFSIGWNYTASQGETDFFNHYLPGAATAPAFNFYQYQTGTTALLAASITKGGNLTLAGTLNTGGATFPSGGISFGSNIAASATDLSKHIALFSNTYGISITGATVNIVAGSLVAMQLTNSGAVKISAALQLDTANTTGRSITYMAGGLNRWALQVLVAESGTGNAGGNISLTRYDDTGTSLGVPLGITRSSGAISLGEAAATVTIGGALTASGVTAIRGGMNFGNAAAAGVTDFSKHIALFSTTYGIGIQTTPDVRMFYGVPAGAKHVLQIGTTDGLTIAGPGAGAVTSNLAFNAPAGGTLTGMTLAGTTTATTPAPGDNSTNVATTAFVQAAAAAAGVQTFNTRSGAVTLTSGDVLAVLPASTITPVMDGIAAVGVNATSWARADHAHPSDTSRVTAAGGTLTGGVVSGGTITGSTGIDFGGAVASSTIDLSRHIALFSTLYGFNITSNRLGYVAPASAQHTWSVGGTDYFTVQAGVCAVLGGIPFGLGNSKIQWGTNVEIAYSGADGASSSVNNLRLSSWQGVGFQCLSVAGQQVPAGCYGFYVNTRTGNTNVNRLFLTDTLGGSQIQNLRFSVSGADQIIDSPNTFAGYAGLTSATPVAGGTGCAVNDRFYDAYGNFYTATAVTTGAVTTIRMDTRAAYSGGAPANPVALTAAPGFSGTGVTVNLTWTLSTRIVLQHTTGSLLLNSANGTTVQGPANFLSVPTAPTPTQQDNSTNLATTAYVDRVKSSNQFNAASGNQTATVVTAAYDILMIIGTGAGPFTLTLPVGTSTRRSWTITNQSNVTVTVAGSSGGTVAFAAGQFGGVWTDGAAIFLDNNLNLPTAGGTVGGISFGAVTAASATDLSKHIALFGAGYGFSITGGSLNVVSGAVAVLNVGTAGLTVNGSTTLTGTTTISTGGPLTITGTTSGNPAIELGRNDSANTPFIDFHTGNNADYDARIIATGGSPTAGQGTMNLTAATVVIAGGTVLRPGTTNVTSCGASGSLWTAVWATNGTIQTSDVREKKNVRTVPACLDLVNRIDPVTFEWREKPDDRTHWGFDADNVREVMASTGIDFGGCVEPEDGPKGLNVSQMVAVLWKAVQELAAQNRALQERIA